MEGQAHAAASRFGVFGALALALAGFGFSFTPWAQRLDMALLDREWAVLRAVAPRAAPDDIVVVGIDEASVNAVPQPLGAWNQPLGEVLVRIASGKPQAVALALPLPDRSLDVLAPGLDRALLVGLAAVGRNAPLVVALPIDAATHAARPMFPPYYALLGKERLGIDLWPRDVDGTTRRFSLRLPTQDGAFPTLAGRLCEVISGRCREGLVDFALGAPYRYVPFREVLEMRDAERVKRLFRDRIVLIGDVRRAGDRVPVPVNLAGWEPPAGDTPGVLLHAQALRTAMLGTGPEEAPRPAVVVLGALAALVLLLRRRHVALLAAGLGAVALAGLSLLALHGGSFVPVAAALCTLGAGAALQAAYGGARRPRPG
ncbi:MAG TPA: CHASE2 domain-containing protein [Usitatibacter sp.]